MEEFASSIPTVFISYIFSLSHLECLAQQSHSWLTPCLASQRILSSCLCIFGHKEEGKKDGVRGSQGDFRKL